MSPSHDENETASPTPKSRKRWGCGAVLLLVLALLTASAAVAYWLWSSEPAYVAENREFLRSHSQTELESMAAALENRISRQLTELPTANGDSRAGATRMSPRTRSGSHDTHTPDHGTTAPHAPGDDNTPTSFEELQQLARQTGTREIEMSVQELNAWLTTRSEKWLANEGLSMPEQVSEPMIAIEGQQVVVGFNFSEGDFSQWVSLSLDVDATATGQATVRLAGVRGGRLPLPAKRALENGESRLAERVDPETLKQVQDALEGKTVNARIQLDQRLATLVDFKAEGQKVTLTLRVEPVTPDNAKAAEGAPGL